MNIFSKILTLGLIISFFSISSCTVEKRIHRNGYHIEWKNKKYSVTPIESNTKINAPKMEGEPKLVEIQNEDKLTLISKNINPQIKETNSYLDNKQSDKKIIIPQESNQSKCENLAFTKKIKRLKAKSNSLSLNPYSKADHQRMTGVLMLVAALLLFGLGYVFFLYLGTFGLILFWIFGIGSAIIFLLGLLYTIFG